MLPIPSFLVFTIFLDGNFGLPQYGDVSVMYTDVYVIVCLNKK